MYLKGNQMTSAAEQMAANMSWSAFGKATELRQRIVFAIILLIVYRIGTYIPVPGIDNLALKQFELFPYSPVLAMKFLLLQ